MSLLVFLKQRMEFRFRSIVCNGSHDLLIMTIDINRIAILKIDGVDYSCIFVGISKNEAINIFEIADLSENNGRI